MASKNRQSDVIVRCLPENYPIWADGQDNYLVTLPDFPGTIFTVADWLLLDTPYDTPYVRRETLVDDNAICWEGIYYLAHGAPVSEKVKGQSHLKENENVLEIVLTREDGNSVRGCFFVVSLGLLKQNADQANRNGTYHLVSVMSVEEAQKLRERYVNGSNPE